MQVVYDLFHVIFVSHEVQAIQVLFGVILVCHEPIVLNDLCVCYVYQGRIPIVHILNRVSCVLREVIVAPEIIPVLLVIHDLQVARDEYAHCVPHERMLLLRDQQFVVLVHQGPLVFHEQ